LLGSIPAIYKDDAKKPLNRSGEGSKLGSPVNASSAAKTSDADVLGVHGAPTQMQEG